MFLNRSIVVIAMVATMLSPAFGQRGLSPQIQSELRELKKEPTIQEAQRAALRFFNIDPGSVQAMRGRASLKGLMPQLEARYRQNNSDLVQADNPFITIKMTE